MRTALDDSRHLETPRTSHRSGMMSEPLSNPILRAPGKGMLNSRFDTAVRDTYSLRRLSPAPLHTLRTPRSNLSQVHVLCGNVT